MPKTSEMEQSLLDVTKIKSKSGEDRQDYFKRIIASVQELPEDTWEELPEATQQWVNDGAKAGNAKKTIDDFPDLKASKEDDVKTKTKTKTAKADKTDKKKPAKEAATEKESTKKKAKTEKEPKKEKKAKVSTRGSGLEATIKNLILKKPSISADELVEKLEAKEVKASRFTVVAIRAGFRHSIKVLADAGMIKGELAL